MPDTSGVTAIANHTLANAWSYTSAFAIVIIIVAILFMFAWYVGRGPFIALLTSIYVGYALYHLFPYASFLPTAPPLTALFCDLGLFALLVALAYAVLRRTAASDFLSVGPIGLFILSILGAGLVMALLYQVFPTRAVYHFTPLLNTLFAPKDYFFWWFAAPLAGLFFLAR